VPDIFRQALPAPGRALVGQSLLSFRGRPCRVSWTSVACIQAQPTLASDVSCIPDCGAGPVVRLARENWVEHELEPRDMVAPGATDFFTAPLVGSAAGGIAA
jgi:hypothetical protein